MKQLIFFLTTLIFVSVGYAQETALVLRVKDGDTFVAKWKHRIHTCRIEHIDAPELSQSYGYKSYEALHKIIYNKYVRITAHKKDLYGRTLVTVTTEGRRLDSLLIRKGYAWHYTSYSNDALLQTCMERAIRYKVGLWACNPTSVCAPWQYRTFSYEKKQRYNQCQGAN